MEFFGNYKLHMTNNSAHKDIKFAIRSILLLQSILVSKQTTSI